jgi:hypothetical protein
MTTTNNQNAETTLPSHAGPAGRALRRVAATVALLAMAGSAAAAVVEVQGVPLDDSITLAGQSLQLNGAGFRKRGYFKVDVSALYLPSRQTTLEGVEKAPGAKRMELVIQQDISGSKASSYFLTDFESSAGPGEFAQLISEVSQIGDIYSGIRQIKKGDIVALDVIPGKGCMASLNGTALMPHGQTSPYFTNPLLCRILFRMYIGGKTPADLRDNLLGQSYSMRDKPPTAAELAAVQQRAAPPAMPASTSAVLPVGTRAASSSR